MFSYIQSGSYIEPETRKIVTSITYIMFKNNSTQM